ncbi:sensor histidine kinase [Qipengyuania qiaonensis]|uniref:Signal transduction histidine kinase subgroup 3 dimerisation and phosphoacceptor domain-containing protein n=1 Tax=Qipengyuania qiaonensis TaxID=2867240 RepID=A0ABS7J9T0_9SPHN|nr:histidine kinase [Qipengyuania qiaonensis]MBX7484087.1 hypothetical protein [Qipengyuania qiaonensis]
MPSELSSLPTQIETIAELRTLYRAAEARAARMRLLSVTGSELAKAHSESIDTVLADCATRLAFFLGRRSAVVTTKQQSDAMAIPAPGPDGTDAGWITIDGIHSLGHITDEEDREAVRLQLELMGTTIDRIRRERERSHLLATLGEREKRLETLVRRIFGAQEDERRRVSQELHDSFAQTATALARMLEGADGERSGDLPASERARLAEIAREMVRELRVVIGGLRPTLLDDLGLEAALQALSDRLQGDGYEVHICLPSADARLPAPVESALFRVAQEAVTNIRKHAGGPCPVFIELLPARADQAGRLRIEDHGKGAPALSFARNPIASGDHIGIEVMAERMSAVGGRLEWVAGKDYGVTVTAWLPQRPAE